MKKLRSVRVFAGPLLFAFGLFTSLEAATPANEDFQDYVVDNVTLANPYDRHAIRYAMSGAIMRIIDGAGYGSQINSRILYFNYGWQAVTTFSVGAPSTSDTFPIASMKVDPHHGGTTYLIEGLDDGVVVAAGGTVDFTASGTYGSIDYTKIGTASGTITFNATTDPNWRNIDTIRFTATSGSAIAFIDDLVFADLTPPTVVSITRQSPSGSVTGATSVVYAVTFSENVTGVDASSFAVVPVNGGTITGTISSVTGGPSVYAVTATITGGSGDFRLGLTQSATASVFATGVGNPAALDFDASGNLYVADSDGNKIYKVTSGGVVSTFASGFFAPYGLAFGPDGDLYVADLNWVRKITPAGVVSTFASGFSVAGGMAFDADGNLFVGNYGDSTISKVTSAGVVSTFATDINAPFGLTFDTTGNLYVANRDTNTITKITPGGTKSTFASGFNGPHEMEFDAAGNLYVADRWGTPRVAVVTPDGAVSTLVGGLDAPAGMAKDSAGDLFITNYYVGKNVVKLTFAKILDAAGNALSDTGFSASEVYSYDNTAPTVNSVTVPANGTYGAGQNLDFTVNFSENVLVDTSGGTPRIALTLGTGGTVYAGYVSGSGTSSLVFRYTIAAGNLDSDGIAVGTLSTNGGSMTDAASNSAVLTLNSVGSTASVLVDGVAPSVSSINRVSAALTNASSLNFTATFSEDVTGVDASDFTLNSTGTAAGAISGVTAVNGSTYTVSVTNVSGDGALRLELKNTGTGISDTAGNAIGVGFTSGQSYTIDTTPPLISGQPVGGTYVAGDTFILSVNASDSQALSYQWMLNGDPLADFTNRSGSTTATVTHSGIGTVGFSGNYTVVVSDAAGNTTTSSVATVVVNRAEQTITFPTIADHLTTSAPFGISATASSGFVVTFSVLSGPATVSGNTVTVTGAGTVTIRAAQAGDINIKPAVADNTFAVSKAIATLSLADLNRTYDGSAKIPSAVTTPAGLTVEFTYDGNATAPVDVGSYAVIATIADATYQGSGSGTLTIDAADQTVTFNPPAGGLVGSPLSLTATASSGLPVSFVLVSGSATLSGATLTPTAAGDIVVRAVQSGNSNYHSASVERTLTASKVAQTITFDALPNRLISDPSFALIASASSGLPVAFEIVDGPATLSGSTVTLLGASGTVSIRASQSGNPMYAAATDVVRSFTIGATGPQVYFGETTQHDTIAAVLAPDNARGSIIGYLGGSNQGFVVDFTLEGDGTFHGLGTVFGTPQVSAQSVSARKPQARAVTLSLTGVAHNGVLSGTIDETNLAFTATIEPPTGSTAAIAGYYTAPATDTATGSMYSVVGTAGEIFVLAITPDLVVSGSGAADAAGGFAIVPSSSMTIAGQIHPATATISSTLKFSGVSIDFNGIATTTTRTDRLVNLSSRGTVSPKQPLIAGFVIGGTETKRVLLRGIGPTLTKLGVSNALTDPKLRLFNQRGEVLFENDNWTATSELTQATQQVGAFATDAGSKDAALLVNLPPGAYTMHVWSDAGTGVALAEVYDAGDVAGGYQRLLNISSRSLVGAGENVLIGGFVVTGNLPKRLLVRGCGPALARFGLTGVLPNPTLSVIDNTGELIARNDDWGRVVTVQAGQTSGSAADISAAALSTGAFPFDTGSKDAALIVTLNPGVYTVVLADETNTGGDGMVEIYELP